MSEAPAVRRRTVATRVLLSYAVVTAAFALAASWSVVALRNSSREADLMRSGYLPLALALRDLVANQDTWNTQLNHITTIRNPADKRAWFETDISIGRPRIFGEVRAAIVRAFLAPGNASAQAVGSLLLDRTNAIERFFDGDRERLNQLFEALDQADTTRADKLSAEMVTRGNQGKRELSALEQRVQGNVDALLDAARSRERRAIQILVALAAFAVLVGVGAALYTRRLLKPLGAVTERAKAVGRGDLTPRPVVASNDEIGELAATFESMVSAIAQASEQLLTAERLATIGKMAAHVTHEIRNPLSSIGLNIELLEEELQAQDGETRTLLRAIKNEVERLNALSGQYLSVARRAPLRLENEDMGELVGEASDFMRADLKRHGVDMRMKIDPDLPTVRADEAQIKQALFNLLRNAREAMPSGGNVTIGVHRASGGGVDLTIDDEGVGIDEETRGRLFEPFFTTKGHGTGLGLAITRQIIEDHGGCIGCEPRSAGGTRFLVHLPESGGSVEAKPHA
jgi:two-component system, NtrC family, sensor kinase